MGTEGEEKAVLKRRRKSLEKAVGKEDALQLPLQRREAKDQPKQEKFKYI